MQQSIEVLEHDGKRINAILTASNTPGASSGTLLKRHEADYFLSTMPLRKLILSMNPLPPAEVVEAAKALRYRGLITVNLIIDKTHVSPDHWIYVHEKTVRMGRIGNMNNFSLKMVDDPSKHTALSLEYFSYVDEPFWAKPDHELIELAGYELDKIGLVRKAAVLDGMVLKTAEAYPLYDKDYKEHLCAVLTYLKGFENLHLMGRNGMHRYNNMDIAMLSALQVVNEILVKNDDILVTPQPGHASQQEAPL
jgi:protoporphyrinogen oxidase